MDLPRVTAVCTCLWGDVYRKNFENAVTRLQILKVAVKFRIMTATLEICNHVTATFES